MPPSGPVSCPAGSSSGSPSPALANRPALLLADEPTGQLDAETGHAVMELLRAVVRSEGPASADPDGPPSALVATHDATLLDLADRVPELRDGEIVEH
jgi:putative ABC transport system ATP-binding protein